MAWQPPQRTRRILIAAGAVAAVVATGACDHDDTPPVALPTGTPDAAAPTETPGLPEVASVAPQPDPVAATLGDPATVSGSSLFGDASATIEVTLSGPELVTEVELDTGAVVTPERDVFVVFDVVLEGVEGTYEFNPRHLHLIPSSEVDGWRGEAFGGDESELPTAAAGFESISFGSVSAGDRLSGDLVFDQPESALAGAAVVLRSLLLPDGPAAAYWSLD